MFTTPREAATVSIIRDGENTIEVLLMKRHGNDRFLPNYHVFPGGAMDPQDYEYKFSCDKEIKHIEKFDCDYKKYYGFIMCAVRETFEESGILLAVDEDGNYPVINTKKIIKKFTDYRKLVFENSLSFKEMLMKEKLKPAINNLFYIDRHITPFISPIRYDTRFFAAILPDNQELSPDGDELISFEWITPLDGLLKYEDRKIKLVRPTIKTLEFLNEFGSSDELIAYFNDCAE
ncbi:MAG: NUDIX domain-containing protein [Spirochaetes bacterium]|nr:NUDIX domain-containing protein [Spirochaetota bacterium]